MKKIFVVLLFIIVIGVISIYIFINMYPNSALAPYNPEGPTYKTENTNQIGNPVKQKDQAADYARRAEIENYQTALQTYYKTYNTAPESLDKLVELGLVKSVKLDQVTKLPPAYNSVDEVHGCSVQFPLSDGTTAIGYCK